jgi:hypothetical protein
MKAKKKRKKEMMRMYRKFEPTSQEVDLYEGKSCPVWENQYPHDLNIHLHFKTKAGMRKVKTKVLAMLKEELNK